MALAGTDFITLGELDSQSVLELIRTAREFKATPPPPRLAGKRLAAIFFNPSLRTRFSFQFAMERLGGTVALVNAGSDLWAIEFDDGTVMDAKAGEHVKEAAKVLERYVDAIAIRAFPAFSSWEQDARDVVLRSFAREARVPVINMESSLYHPCQGLADAMTIAERLEQPRAAPICITWAWHPKALPLAVTHSALHAAAHLGMEIRLACPPTYEPAPQVLDQVASTVNAQGGSLTITHDQEEAATGARVVYAKSWAGIPRWGDADAEARARRNLRNWQVNEALMARSDDACFMHCLPVRRNVVVTDGVLDGPHCAVYDEAENRMWAQMAILNALLDS